jgi:hypothetical protein
LNKYKPAHTQIIFDYAPFLSLDFTKSFNSLYLPLGVP